MSGFYETDVNATGVFNEIADALGATELQPVKIMGNKSLTDFVVKTGELYFTTNYRQKAALGKLTRHFKSHEDAEKFVFGMGFYFIDKKN